MPPPGGSSCRWQQNMATKAGDPEPVPTLPWETLVDSGTVDMVLDVLTYNLLYNMKLKILSLQGRPRLQMRQYMSNVFGMCRAFETSVSITKFISISLCIFVISEFIPFSQTPWRHGMVWYVCFCSLPQGSSWKTALINHNIIWSSDLSKYNVHPIKDKCLKLLFLDSQLIFFVIVKLWHVQHVPSVHDYHRAHASQEPWCQSENTKHSPWPADRSH